MGYQRGGAVGGIPEGSLAIARGEETYSYPPDLQYAEFGLDHWGADTKGVNTTRRFLCEAISFQHRYVPIGLLERMPPMMNERPPAYKGRSELGQSGVAQSLGPER